MQKVFKMLRKLLQIFHSSTDVCIENEIYLLHIVFHVFKKIFDQHVN